MIPLFEDLLEKNFTKDQRKIIRVIADLNGNASVKEIANRLHSNDPDSIRAQLAEIRNNGFLEQPGYRRENTEVYIIKSFIFYVWLRRCELEKREESIFSELLIDILDVFMTLLKMSIWLSKTNILKV